MWYVSEAPEGERISGQRQHGGQLHRQPEDGQRPEDQSGSDQETPPPVSNSKTVLSPTGTRSPSRRVTVHEKGRRPAARFTGLGDLGISPKLTATVIACECYNTCLACGY